MLGLRCILGLQRCRGICHACDAFGQISDRSVGLICRSACASPLICPCARRISCGVASTSSFRPSHLSIILSIFISCTHQPSTWAAKRGTASTWQSRGVRSYCPHKPGIWNGVRLTTCSPDLSVKYIYIYICVYTCSG